MCLRITVTQVPTHRQALVAIHLTARQGLVAMALLRSMVIIPTALRRVIHHMALHRMALHHHMEPLVMDHHLAMEPLQAMDRHLATLEALRLDQTAIHPVTDHLQAILEDPRRGPAARHRQDIQEGLLRATVRRQAIQEGLHLQATDHRPATLVVLLPGLGAIRRLAMGRRHQGTQGTHHQVQGTDLLQATRELHLRATPGVPQRDTQVVHPQAILAGRLHLGTLEVHLLAQAWACQDLVVHHQAVEHPMVIASWVV